MKKTAASVMQRRKEMTHRPSQTSARDVQGDFQAGRAPAHRARKVQDWCRGNFPGFWENGTWPGNSPDLSPIENLWAIVREELNKMEPTTSEKTLIQNVQVA